MLQPRLHLTHADLSVRPMTVADAAAVQQCRNDPRVARYQGWRPSVADAERHAREQEGTRPGHSPGVCQLVIERAGVFVGDIGVQTIDPGRQVELGIVVHPDAQGGGVATRALRLVITHLFRDGVHRVTARVDPRNEPSLRLFDRLGLRREGHEVESYWDAVYDEYTDEICFAVLAREWAARS